MDHRKVLTVKREIADQMERFCKEPPGLSETGRDETLFDEEVVFADGMRMAIQVVATNDPDTESCWTQGVLFDKEGNELGCTEVGESFAGEYFVPNGEDTYAVEVSAGL